MPEMPRSLPLTCPAFCTLARISSPSGPASPPRRNKASLGSGYADFPCLVSPAKYPSLSELLDLRLLSRSTAIVPSSGKLLSAPLLAQFHSPFQILMWKPPPGSAEASSPEEFPLSTIPLYCSGLFLFSVSSPRHLLLHLY